jgi:HSP20 family protein
MTYYVTPYRRMAMMRNAMNHWFEDHSPAEREIMLAVDVKASDEAYDITALVPGLDAQDVDIEVLNNTVTIRGEFKAAEDGDNNYLLCELPEGRFSRVISLPTETDPSNVEASIKNGVLSLHVPKAETAKPKSIKVKIN